MNKTKILRITTSSEDLVEGLFGQVFLWIFEILPYLEEQDFLPEWEIRSILYGDPNHEFVVIPGLLDTTSWRGIKGKDRIITNLLQLREHNTVTLGNDWNYLSKLWLKYFSIPDRVIEKSQHFPDLGQTLGLHYRGTDKNRALEETNYVSENDFLSIVDDFITKHPEIKRVFLASDENGFIERVRLRYLKLEVINSGPVVHHKDSNIENGFQKGDHAILDCYLLSQCKYLLKCQSALSGFAKVLNPNLEAYRISANKLTPWAKEIPYFPDGYLPKYESENLECRQLLERLFVDDWTGNSKVAKMFGPQFRYRKRKSKSSTFALLGRIKYGCIRRFERVKEKLRKSKNVISF